MKARLVKLDISPPKESDEQPPVEVQVGEVQVIDTIRSWVHEFKSRKASEARLDFRRINNSEKI